MRHTIRQAALLLLLGFLLFPHAARADFRHARMGARPRALGSAFVSLSDDANALFWNPAGLSRDNRLSVLISRAWLYSVSDLRNDDLIISGMEWKGFHFGAGFLRLGADDVLYEDTYSFAIAREVPWLDGLSLGIANKLFNLTAPGYDNLNDPNYNGGDSGWAWDLGAHYDSGNNWTLGAAVHNINEPYLQLITTTVDPDPVYDQFAVGGSYLFRDTLRLSMDARSRESGWDDVGLYAGAEIWFFDTLALRSGVGDGQISMGFGLQDAHWQLDVALENHEELKDVYILSFTVRD
jgi:hypothetical protein